MQHSMPGELHWADAVIGKVTTAINIAVGRLKVRPINHPEIDLALSAMLACALDQRRHIWDSYFLSIAATVRQSIRCAARSVICVADCQSLIFAGGTMSIETPFRNISNLKDALATISDDIHDICVHGRPESIVPTPDAPWLENWSIAALYAPCLTGEVRRHHLLVIAPHSYQPGPCPRPRGGWART